MVRADATGSGDNVWADVDADDLRSPIEPPRFAKLSRGVELGSLPAGIPIALVVLLVGAVGGLVGLVIATAALIAVAVICARRSYLGLAGGLLLGLGVIVVLTMPNAFRQ